MYQVETLVIWVPMLKKDTKEAADVAASTFLPRATHRFDTDGAAASWAWTTIVSRDPRMARFDTFRYHKVWDTFMLYRNDATWPHGPSVSGATVLEEGPRLLKALEDR